MSAPGGFAAALAWLARGMPRDRARVLAFQAPRLRAVLRHAYERVPYYRRLLDRHGLRPGDLTAAADLARVPVSSKQDRRRAHPADLLAAGVDPARLVLRTTSGATGEPTTVRRTRLEELLLAGFRLRAIRALGYRATDRTARIALIRRAPVPLPGPARVLGPLGLYRLRQIQSIQPTAAVVRELRRYRPSVVTGFADPVWRAAAQLDDADRCVIRPRLVVVGGEVLTPAMRRGIRAGFAAPVYEWYGSHETNVIAWECRATGYLHTCDDAVVVEIVRDGRAVAPGERGEVVVTTLHSYAMPFIRYRLGDIATRGPEVCPCGAPFGTLRAIQGRMHDWLVLPGGRLLHPYALILELHEHFHRLSQYQLVQEREDRIVLRLATGGDLPAAERERLETRLRSHLGEGVTLSVALVPAIDVDAAGKTRPARSRVRSAYDDVDWTRV